MSQEFQDYLAWFEQGVTGLSNSTGNMMREMVYQGPASFDGLIVYESVAIDYFKKAKGRWGDLYVVYPDYNIWNDNPYYVLDTAWTTEAHQQAAETFLDFLMSEPVQQRALEHGFRPGNPSVSLKGPASPFTRHAQFGLRIDLPAVCEPPSPEVIDNLQQSWIRNAVPR
jgi:ABC-type sulfate transport system substrate-binding protein